MTRFTTLLIIAMAVISFSPKERSYAQPSLQESPAVLSVFLKSGERIPINVFDVHTRAIQLKNLTGSDTLINQEIAIKKASFMYYGNILVLPDGPSFRTYSLLLMPGDTVLLNREKDGAVSVGRSTGYPDFIDSLISIPDDYYAHNGERKRKLVEAIGITGVLHSIDSLFGTNEIAIGKLALSNQRRDLLRTLNTNIRYTAIAHLLNDPKNKSSELTDSLYNEVYAHLNDIRSIDAINNQKILEAIVSYNARKRHPEVDVDNIWALAAGVDESLGQTDYYKDYLTSIVAGNFVNSPKEIGDIKERLKTIRTSSPFLDTLYHVTTILSESFDNYREAKQKLQSFADGHYSFIMADNETPANHGKKTMTNLPFVALYDFEGKESDFKRVVTNDQYKLTLVDLWASWCIPCIMEMPALGKVEEKLKDKPIQFLAVSIDKEQDVDKWIASAKENKLFDKPHQYRLANFKTSPFTQLIHLTTIPRYLVIDNKGNILDADFLRPSDSRFEAALLKYLDGV